MPHRSLTAARVPGRTLTAVSRPWLSVVVPAYNEAPWIVGAVEQMRERLEALGRPWELIVVDNASPDGTADRLAPLESDERIRVLRNEVNRGKGYSVRRGMLAAAGELRLHCDADCAASFASLPALLAELGAGADVVVGSRLARGARLGRRQPLRRRIVGRSFVLLCRAVLREPTSDLFCGFKLWRAEAATTVYGRSSLDGWTFDAETLALARALGFRLREVGVEWSDREGSRLSMARVLVPVVRELAEARRHVRRELSGRAPETPESAEAASSAG
jgi:glycosyltransferase involved in cell wall biosynthesis